MAAPGHDIGEAAVSRSRYAEEDSRAFAAPKRLRPRRRADLAAVRSSATAEDLPGRSFAGQYDSHLGVAAPDECVAAIKACWASLWSDRAYEYREKNGIDHLAVDMAVIVQKLVRAEASGVLFTADPVSGARDRIVIESAFGLGEAVVGGRVSPDRVVVAKDELRVVESTVSRKTVEIVPRRAEGLSAAAQAGDQPARHRRFGQPVCRRTGRRRVPGRRGTVERPVEAERAQMPAVDEVTALRLAVLGARIEKEFGCPQDVEWAVCSGAGPHRSDVRPAGASPHHPEVRPAGAGPHHPEVRPAGASPRGWLEGVPMEG